MRSFGVALQFIALSGVLCYRDDFSEGYHYQKEFPQDVMVDVINNFGLALLEAHNERNDNNIALSPYGATSVLIALGEGLRGPAAYEIQDSVHIPLDMSVIRIGLRDIHRHLKSYFIPKEGFLSGMTLSSEKVPLNPDYEEILRFYGYDIDSFNNPLYPEFQTQPNTTTETIPINVTKSTEISTDGMTQTMEEASTTETVDIVSTLKPENLTRIPTTSTLVTDGTLSTNTESTKSTEMETERTRDSEIISNFVTTLANEITKPIDLSTQSTIFDTISDATTPASETTHISPEENLSTVTTGASSSTDNLDTFTIDTTNQRTTRQGTFTTLPVDSTSTLNPTIISNFQTESFAPETSPTTEKSNLDGSTINGFSDTILSTISPETTQNTEDSTSELVVTSVTKSVTTLLSESTTGPKSSDDNETLTTDESTESEESTTPTGDSKRKSRSVVDYIIAKYHDSLNEWDTYEPDESPSFFVYGRIREPNINFMTYDAVLPFAYVPMLKAMALSFPLDSKEYYLLLILPVDVGGVDRVICDFKRTSLKEIVGSLKYMRVKATIPSFMLKGYVVLTPTLQKLGIRRIFEPRHSDFTLMTREKDVYVTNIEQAVTVTIRNYVDQDNLPNYRSLQHVRPVEYKADRPFLYFVMDSDVHVCLMAGKIVNPLNSRIR